MNSAVPPIGGSYQITFGFKDKPSLSFDDLSVLRFDLFSVFPAENDAVKQEEKSVDRKAHENASDDPEEYRRYDPKIVSVPNLQIR